MHVLLIFAVVFQFLAAYLSFRFVLRGRLGKPWILVSVALTIVGGLHIFSHVMSIGDPYPPDVGFTIEMIEFAVSFLMGIGFALTERWYLLKERLEGRFRLIGDIDQALIGKLDEGEILSTVCNGLVRSHGCRTAWVGTADPDGSISIEKGTGEQEGFLHEVPLRWDDTPDGSCPPGIAVRTGEVCVVNRVFDDPRTVPWRSAAAKFGIRSFASVRIDLEHSSPLLLSIGGQQKDAFDRLEIEALAAMAYRVGNAVTSARHHEQFVAAKKSYGELFRSQRDGLVLVRGGTIVRVNPAAARILGYSSAGELVGADPAVLFPGPKDSPLLARILQPSFKGGDRIVITEMRRKDGSLFEGEIASSWVPRPLQKNPWYSDYTGPLGLFLFRDVTLRSQTLKDLHRERDFSAKVLDVAETLVLQIGREGEIRTFNRQCEEVTGYRAIDVIGRKMTDFLLPENACDLHLSACEQVQNGKIPSGLEYSLLTKEGEERLVIWNYAAIPGQDGRVGSILAAGTDVTERRRFERSVVSMQKMEAVGTLAGGIAHDFNNILTGILGNLDLARKHIPPDSPAAGAIGESIRASERAAHLIRQLLEFSRRTALERRTTDLKKVVDEVIHLFSQTIDRRIEVSVATTDDLWFVKVDSSQVHQVLMNLCVNARDAIMEKLEGMREVQRKTIWVRAENVTIGEEYCRVYPFARMGEFVALSIADNGVGMDEATQRRVFEPFFTTKGLGRGTGLGLSTVYGIVKQHEGWITLDSEPGTGTTFRCYFPRSTELPEEVGAVTDTKRPLGGTETILLVDDEEMVRDLASQILTMQGYSVLTAADGQQAVDMYRAGMGAIHLVLLDLTMPRMSGLDVLERIHEIDPGAKVILSSGYRADGFHGSERFSEASAFLPKPYRAQMLSRAVRDVLDGVPT